jgi:hypothetical protein
VFDTHFEVLLQGLSYQVGGSLYVTLEKRLLCALLPGVAPDLRNPRSFKSLTGRSLSSLFKKEHTVVLLLKLGLVAMGLPQS